MLPHQEHRHYGANEPLEAFAAFTAIFGVVFFSLWAIGGRQEKKSRFEDAELLANATHKLTTILARDGVLAPFRAPFTRFEKSAGGDPSMWTFLPVQFCRSTVSLLLGRLI
jgi:hypothetical protein